MNEQMVRQLATANIQAAALQATRAQFALEAWKIIATHSFELAKKVGAKTQLDEEGAAVAAVAAADALLHALGFPVARPS